MTSKMRTLLIGGALGTTVLVGLGGGAVAWAQAEGTTPPTEAPTPSTNPGDGLPGRRGEWKADMDAKLAEKLGTTADAVSAARRSAHDAVVAELGEMTKPDHRPTTQEERDALKAQLKQRFDLFEQKFADALGISVDDLKTAQLAVAKDELDAKVAAGELTQEQADARLQALQNGEIPPGGLHGRGPRGAERHENREELQGALAAELGTTTDELTAARKGAHDAVVAELGPLTRPENPPATDEERQALKDQLQQRFQLEQQKFAEALGISVDDLKAAELSVAKDQLDAKVAAGELTQEQADARLQALQNGELPEIGRGPHGRHGRFGGGPFGGQQPTGS